MANSVHLISRQVGTTYPMLEFYKLLKVSNFDVHFYAYPDSLSLLQDIPHQIIENFEDYQNKIASNSKPKAILTGTSQYGQDDQKFWHWARSKNILSLAWLDQAIGLELRFPNLESLPDIILATTQELLTSSFMQSLSCEKCSIGSPYLDKLLKEIKRETNSKNMAIFATEPTSELYFNEHGVSDTISFEQAYQSLSKYAAEMNQKWDLIIKVHPRDDEARWKKNIEEHTSNLRINTKIESINNNEAFRNTKLVLGMRSMFLVEAAALGIHTISFQEGRKTDSPLIDHQNNILLSLNKNLSIKDMASYLTRPLKPYFEPFDEKRFISFFL